MIHITLGKFWLAHLAYPWVTSSPLVGRLTDGPLNHCKLARANQSVEGFREQAGTLPSSGNSMPFGCLGMSIRGESPDLLGAGKLMTVYRTDRLCEPVFKHFRWCSFGQS